MEILRIFSATYKNRGFRLGKISPQHAARIAARVSICAGNINPLLKTAFASISSPTLSHFIHASLHTFRDGSHVSQFPLTSILMFPAMHPLSTLEWLMLAWFSSLRSVPDAGRSAGDGVEVSETHYSTRMSFTTSNPQSPCFLL